MIENELHWDTIYSITSFTMYWVFPLLLVLYIHSLTSYDLQCLQLQP